jgi:hypothetical protein
MMRIVVCANGPMVLTTTAGDALRSCASSDSREPDTVSALPRLSASALTRAGSRAARTRSAPLSCNRSAIPRPDRPVAPRTQILLLM